MADPEQDEKERNQNYFLVREEPFTALKEFSRVFAKAISAFAMGDQKKLSAIRSAFWLECSFCRMQVGGEEILSMSGPSDSSRANPTIKRIMSGHCGREGCESPKCCLFFSRDLAVEWPEIFVHVQKIQNSEKRAAAKGGGKKRFAFKRFAFRFAWPRIPLRTLGRVGIGMAILAIVLFVRHWHAGGRIPLLREPEKFRVAPLPPGETENHH